MLRIIAPASGVEGCPLYQKGDALSFCGTSVEGQKGVPVCAVAVAALQPLVRKIADGADPDASKRTFCGGCAGKAWFDFVLIEEPDSTVTGDHARFVLESLQKTKIFHGAPSRQVETILPMLKECRFTSGEEIIVKGQPGRAFHVVTDGEVEVLNVDEHGNETLLVALGKGESFGEMSLITGDLVSATVRAKGDVATVAIGKADFPEVMAKIPVLNLNLARLLAQRLAKTGSWVMDELKKGMIGKLDKVSPAELVQAMNVNGQTGTLVVQSGQKSMAIYFHQGQIGDVVLGDKHGEEAFYEFLTWAKGQFQFDATAKAVAPTSSMDTMGLLLEGMRRIDEATKIRYKNA